MQEPTYSAQASTRYATPEKTQPFRSAALFRDAKQDNAKSTIPMPQRAGRKGGRGKQQAPTWRKNTRPGWSSSKSWRTDKPSEAKKTSRSESTGCREESRPRQGRRRKGQAGQHSVKRQHAGKLHEHAQDDEPQRTRDARCYNARHGDKTAPYPLRVGHLDLQNSTRIRWRICADESLSFESTQMHRPHNPLNGRMVSTEPSAPSGNTVAHLAESVP